MEGMVCVYHSNPSKLISPAHSDPGITEVEDNLRVFQIVGLMVVTCQCEIDHHTHTCHKLRVICHAAGSSAATKNSSSPGRQLNEH